MRNNSKLKALSCKGNHIPSLDLSNNTLLEKKTHKVYFYTTETNGHHTEFEYYEDLLTQYIDVKPTYNSSTKKMDVYKSDLSRLGLVLSKVSSWSAEGSGAQEISSGYSFKSPVDVKSYPVITAKVKTNDPVNVLMPVKFRVVPKQEITTNSLDNGKAYTIYDKYVYRSDNAAGRWTISKGKLPDGLFIFNSYITREAGNIYGRPSNDGKFRFTMRFTADDSKYGWAEKEFIIVIGPKIKEAQDWGSPKVGSDYDFTPQVEEKVDPGAWSKTAGSLPNGLSFDTGSGRLHGTPNQDGKYEFTLKFKNVYGEDVISKKDFTVAPAVKEADLATARMGTGYAATLNTRGKCTEDDSAKWSLAGGKLPDGLTLNKKSGKISGTPQKPGTYNFSAKFTNKYGSDTKQFSITVKAAIKTGSLLPDAKIGEQYSETLEMPAGSDPGTWSVSQGRLPEGLSLDEGSGKISGYPKSEGTYSFQAAYRTAEETISKTFSIKVGPAISTDVLPGAMKGKAYGAALEVNPGTTNGTWSASGNFPAGLKINSRTGRISGVPTTAGTCSFIVTFKNKYGEDSKGLSIHVAESGTVVNELPEGKAGSPYAVVLASPRTKKGSWTVSGGSLPEGLTLHKTSGLISGTPAKAGDYSFTASFKDSEGTVKLNYTVRIIDADAPEIVTDSALSRGKLGSVYTANLETAAGTPAGKWSVVKGKLPAGLSLNEGTGKITGTPKEDGTFEFKAVFKNDSGAATRTFIIKVEPAIKTGALPGVKTGDTYTKKLETFEGAAKGVWSIEGALPDGLSFDKKTGTISGTVTKAGCYDFIVRFSNVNGSDSKLLEIVVGDDGEVMRLKDGKVGQPYECYLAGTGSWSIAYGTLPAGLTLDPKTGRIHGTPTEAGSKLFLLQYNGKTIFCGLSVLPADGLSITTNEVLPTGVIDGKYDVVLEASQSEGLTWTLDEDSNPLPDGLTLDPNSGNITGTPQKAGTYYFKVKCTNKDNESVVKGFAITINPAEITVDPVLPGGDTGEEYEIDITVDDNTGKPGKWSVTDGELPPGMDLDQNTGEITGTPTKPGDYDFSITYTNEHGTVTKDFHFHVDPGIAIDHGNTEVNEGGKIDISFTLPDDTKPGE
ncbi:MAG: Ig domain-containing protein [Anaerovoracaceae bacterium]